MTTPALATHPFATGPLAGALPTPPNAAQARDTVYVAELVAYDPALPGTRTFRYATHAFATRGTDDPAHTVIDGRLAVPGDVSRALGSGLIPGPRATISFGELVLSNADGALDALGDYGWGGRTVTVRRGPRGGQYPYDFPVDYVAEVEAIAVTRREVRLRLRDGRRELETPLQQTRYLGDNVPPDGLEGGSDIGGTPKPLVYGTVRNVPLVPVNAQKLIYQVSDTAASVVSVRDNGVDLGFAFVTDTISALSGTDLRQIIWDGTRYVALRGPITSGQLLWYSADGVTWTPDSIASTSSRWTCIDSSRDSNPGYYAGNTIGEVYVTSPPFSSATSAGTTGFGLTPVLGIAWSQSRTRAVAIAASLQVRWWDGFTWQSSVTPPDEPLAVCRSDEADLFCVVGENGMILTSPDADSVMAGWTTQTSGTTAHLRHVYYGDGRFVAVGDGGVIVSSPDGIAWRVHESNTTNTLSAGTWTGRWHIVGGTTGPLLRSQSLDSWEPFGTDSVTPGGIASNGRRMVLTQSTTTRISRAPLSYANATDLEDPFLPPPPGGYGVLSSASGTYVRLGAQPFGQVTADVTHGATAANRTAGQLMLDVLTEAGYTAADWVAADFTALDAAASGVCGLRLTTETAAEALDRLADSVGAWWGFDARGRVRVQQFTAPSGTPVATFTDDDLLEFDQLPVGQPSTSTTLRYDRNYVVQRDGLAGIVPAARRAELGREWRAVVSSTPAVATAYPLAEETTEDTALATAAAATAEASRRQTLRGTLRRRYTATVALTDATAALELGDVVQVTASRFGMSGGVLLRVTGLDTRRADRRLRLTLYR